MSEPLRQMAPQEPAVLGAFLLGMLALPFILLFAGMLRWGMQPWTWRVAWNAQAITLGVYAPSATTDAAPAHDGGRA